jgi:DNA-binding response OmpR family regulator
MREKPVVVVVDDDAMLLTIVEAKLRSRGYRVVAVQDGLKASDIIVSEMPDLVVLDCMMPGIEGLEILAIIKAVPAIAGTPVVMLTARKQEADIVAALKAGVSDYLVKPFIPEELVMRIQRLLPPRAA